MLSYTLKTIFLNTDGSHPKGRGKKFFNYLILFYAVQIKKQWMGWQ